jgi:hypothetical protein
MVGMKSNLKETLEIANTVTNPRVNLQARAIVSDCYKFILDMSTNAGKADRKKILFVVDSHIHVDDAFE